MPPPTAPVIISTSEAFRDATVTLAARTESDPIVEPRTAAVTALVMLLTDTVGATPA